MHELNLFDLWAGLLGGLALFLFGMDIMTRALKVVAGDRMKDVLAKLTKNRFVGAITGAVVTAIINSSSVTTVIMVGFISAGLVSMAQCISVIMGANIGSTMTAQILAFKVTKLALPMITIGFGMWFLSKKENIRQYGGMIMGLGLVFYGMGVMSDAMKPLRTYEPFLNLMVSMDTLLLAVLVGAAFTAVIQSSAATTGIVIVMASQGLISLDGAVAIAFGANIGTCATAGLAVIGKPREAVRAAVVHVLFNITGVIIWLPFFHYLIDFVVYISPQAAGLEGTAKVAAEAPRQIANAHTFFNVANTLIFIWFTPLIARLVEWMIPDKPLEESEIVVAKYLEEELVSTPSLALERVRMELGRMGERLQDTYGKSLHAVVEGKADELEHIRKADEEIDTLHGYILKYLGQVGVASEMSVDQSQRQMDLITISNHLEHIGDVMENNLVNCGLSRIENKIKVSEQTKKVLADFHEHVGQALQDCIYAVVNNDVAMAQKVFDMKGNMAEQMSKALEHEAVRLIATEPNRLATYTREIEIIENFNRIFKFCRRCCKVILESQEQATNIVSEASQAAS